MTTWAVIPVKAPEDSKTRLAGVLDAAARAALVRAMLERVVAASSGLHTCLLGPSRHGLPDDLPLLDDPGGGLNHALASALRQVAATSASRVLFLPADLPQITALDVQLLAAAPAGTIAIAPDRHGTGTNALSLPLPEASGFAFAFGPDSFARHYAEAERLGLGIETIRSSGLAHDIDEPDDLPDAADLL